MINSNNTKFFTLLFITILGFIGMYLIQNYYLSNMKKIFSTERYLQSINLDILKLRKDEKDFLSRKEMKYVITYKSTYKNLESNIKKLKKSLQNIDKNITYLDRLLQHLNKYSHSFYTIVEHQNNIGLDHTKGLYGTLRKSIHKVQKILNKSKNYKLISEIYNLRKHEKDFMLRKDIEYYDRFVKLYKNSVYYLKDNNLKVHLNIYKENFMKLVLAEEQKGFKENFGLQGIMRTSIHKTENLVIILNSDIQDLIKKEVSNTKFITIFTILVLLLMVLAVNFILTKNNTEK